MTYHELAQRVRDDLAQDHRFDHVVRVARAAEVLAMHHGVSAPRARTAGMLHDLARLYSTQRLLHECHVRAITVDAFARANPIVLHAPIGAELARERYGIDDGEILSAIAKHTLADAAMSPLDMVVYLGDTLEPGRDFPQRAGLWTLALTDLTQAMRRTLENSVEYLQRQGLAVAPQTEAALAAFTHLTRTEPSLN